MARDSAGRGRGIHGRAARGRTGAARRPGKICRGRVRRVAGWIFPLPGRGRGPLHHFFSEFFDWNEPPLFKNFLRIDASREEVRIRCFAATGCAEHEDSPPLEDEIRIPLQ